MALYHQLPLMSIPSAFTRLPPGSCRVVGTSSSNVMVPGRVRCSGAAELSDEAIVRRSANYTPTIWGHDFIQSLTSHVGKSSDERAEKLKEEVRLMLDSAVESVQQLELIDVIQRLGLSYQFEDEIKGILDRVYNNKQKQDDLYAVALEFRLLRQHYYDASAGNSKPIKEIKLEKWADICKSYLLEVKWYHSGSIPTLAEYMNNAWISISGPVILVHAYFLDTDPITEEAAECLAEYSNIICWSSTILRLANDLGTSSDELERGDVAKSIQCYMHETGASQEDGREHIGEMIAATWMKMNRDWLENPHLSTTFIDIAMNLGRMAQCIYQHGDGHGIEVGQTRNNVLSVLVNPIQIQSVDSSE